MKNCLEEFWKNYVDAEGKYEYYIFKGTLLKQMAPYIKKNLTYVLQNIQLHPQQKCLIAKLNKY